MAADIRELIPDPAILIKGLRDTGYELNTALADIVDNSVDAKASIVDIRLELQTNGMPYVTIADDGCGMNLEELIDGMKYGSSSTSAKSPQRLGKFGLGLKTASTAFCKKLSVISKKNQEDLYYMATWDLDVVANANKWDLMITKEEDIPSRYKTRLNTIAKDGHGTLVIWEKIDRFANPGQVKKKDIDRKAAEFSKYASMIYHRFLDPDDNRARNIKMNVNGAPLKGWDPFCLREMRTTDDKGTLLLQEEEKPCEVVMENGQIINASFTVKAYALPYKEDFSSEESRKEAALTNRNMGFYIYRENRMISNADWLGMRQKEAHDTYSRIEFSFNHEMDPAFKIDVKKAKISLNPDLYEWLDKWSAPAVRFAQIERYRRHTDENRAKGAADYHKDSDKNISRNENNAKISNVTVIPGTKSADGTQIAEVQNASTGSTPLRIRINTPKDTTPGMSVFVEDNVTDGLLWTPTVKDNHHAVIINASHPFYKKVYVPNHAESDVMCGLDAMFWALCETEYGLFNSEDKETFDDLKRNVSSILRKLVKDLPDPNED